MLYAVSPYNLPMDILLTIAAAAIVLGFLVFIHEGGHFLAARAFGVRVSEFMIGLPGPSVGIQRGETRFGLTAVPLGGYARVCGMEPGPMSPYLQRCLQAVYEHGSLSLQQIAAICCISEEDASEAMDELVEWGSVTAPRKRDCLEVYRTPAFRPTAFQRRVLRRRGIEAGPASAEGSPRAIDDSRSLFATEYRQQYRSLPAWKRMAILLAGPLTNLLFALVIFVLVYSVIGVDYTDSEGAVRHLLLTPLQAIQTGFNYIAMVVVAVAGLFNPATAAETVSQSTSMVGIAVMSKAAIEAGFLNALMFTAMLSVSLGIMNLLPIPPLDGGRFVVEVYQRIRRKVVGVQAMNYLSLAGMALFAVFFIFMMNQDIQRFVFGNWG